MFKCRLNKAVQDSVSKHIEAATGGVMLKSCSKNFLKFHWKTPVLEHLLHKVTCLFGVFF